MPRDNRPSLFIVGAPKCGTTSMASWLGSHPNVFMSKPKEPNFFCTDFPKTREVRDLDSYLGLFRNASNEYLVLAEASTWYLYSEVAIPAILEFNPAARLLVMIRNPIDMAQSLHGQLLFNGIETEQEFARAWSLQDERRHRVFLQYARVCALGQQLSRVTPIVTSGQLKTVIFDDLRANPQGTLQEVVSWLGLPKFEPVELGARNAAKRTRSQTLSRLIRRTPRPLVTLSQRLKRIAGVDSWKLLDRLERFNVVTMQRQSLDQGTLGELRECFRPDVMLLSDLVGRDLTGWLGDDDN